MTRQQAREAFDQLYAAADAIKRQNRQMPDIEAWLQAEKQTTQTQTPDLFEREQTR